MRNRKQRLLSGIGPVLLLVAASGVKADLILTFSNADTFDGDVAGSTAGPFNLDGVTGTITTRDVAPSGAVNTTAGRLGVNASSGSDTTSRFDDGERWVFDWDIDTRFQGVNFRDFSTATERFTIQSDAWIGLGISPSHTEITFSDATGTLSFTAGDSADDFTLADLSGGTLLPVSAGTEIAFGFTDAAGGNGSLESLTFGASGPESVPEPGTFALGTLVSSVLVAWRIRRKRWPPNRDRQKPS